MGDGTAERVKERIDIIGLIGESLPLKRAGSNFKARCPFHEEDTPSFMVSPTRQMFHCFGCSESGDVFSWLMKREGMSFPEALRVLASRAGVPLTFERPERREERERLRETLDLAATFYHRVLLESAEGKDAHAYLEGRGLTAESIASWRLGFCSEAATRIEEKARERQISEEDLVRSGVLYRGQRTFEFFHGRILFPLADAHGSIVGLAGRVFGTARPDAPKYINSPETPLYVKGRILYGLDRAKDAVRKANFAILVEGYTDVILSHQVGITNVIATSGTALTDDHLQILRRFTDQLAFAFDADAGGDAATRRAVDLALAAGFLVSVIVLPEGDDPADLASKAPGAWKAAVGQRNDLFSFFLARALRSSAAGTPDGKRAILTDLLPIIARVPDQVVAGQYVQELARALVVDQRYLAEDLARWKSAQVAGRRGEAARAAETELHSVAVSGTVRREERLLMLLLADPTLISKTAEFLPADTFEAPHTKGLYHALISWYSGGSGSLRFSSGGAGPDVVGPAGGGAHQAALRNSLPKDLGRFLEVLLFAVEVDREREEWDPSREARAVVRDLLLARLRTDLQRRTEDLRAAPPSEREAILREIVAVTSGLARAEQFEW